MPSSAESRRGSSRRRRSRRKRRLPVATEMHILYIHQYFATPQGHVGTRSYEFARRWVAAGHQVTMLTSTAELTEADIGPAPRRGTRLVIDGVAVIALRVRYKQAFGFARRVWSFLCFMIKACFLAARLPRVDVVFATSTPLTIGVPALLAWWLRRRPYVFEVRDAWPAVPIAIGAIRNPLLIWLSRRLERTIYRCARAIVALSPGMADVVRKAAPAGKPILNVPNCADTSRFRPDADGGHVRRTHGWEGRFVCIHAGAMGRLNGLDIVVRAAERFRGEPDYLFVLVGEGSEKAGLEAARDRMGLSNLQIMNGVPKERLPPLLAAADLCLVLFGNVPAMEHNSANKFFDCLSSGKPILLNYSGWQRQAIEAAGAGWGCRMGDEAEFFAKLAAMKESPGQRSEMGRNARKLAVERYDRDLLAGQVLEALVKAGRMSLEN